jgi:hypothetical protein
MFWCTLRRFCIKILIAIGILIVGTAGALGAAWMSTLDIWPEISEATKLYCALLALLFCIVGGTIAAWNEARNECRRARESE